MSGFLALTQIIGLFSINAQAAEITIATGPSAYNTYFLKLAPGFEKQTGIKVKYFGDPSKLSSVDTFAAVAEGKADGGAASLPIDTWVQNVKSKGIAVPDSGTLASRVIGHDILGIAINKEIGVKELDMDQIRRIFTGKAKSWKEVGGPDKPIKIIFSEKNKATSDYFREKFLANEPFAEIQKTDTFKEALEITAKTQGGVTFGAVAALKGEILKPKHPEIGRPTTFITKGKPNGSVQAFLDYIEANKAKSK